jgi:hypothetical protein
MDKDAIRQVVVIVATIAVLVVNALASALPLNGVTTGEISDQFDVFFVPAGYVFSIWGLIYIGLVAYAIYQALPGQRGNPYLRAIGWAYVASCAANIAWIFLWHYGYFALTMLAMLALLLSLIAIYVRLGVGRERVPLIQQAAVNIPFQIYLGWITVATIANATSLLDYVNWGGWGIAPEIWAVIMLVAATAIAAAVSVTRGDVAYVLVIVWAFAGIAVKHAGTRVVATTAWITAAVVALTLAAGVPLRYRRLHRTSG